VKGIRSDHDCPQSECCPRCGAPVLRALVGRMAALDVRADPRSVPQALEAVLRQQGRLTWCLDQSAVLPSRLLWRDPEHAQSGKCSHVVLADHECQPQPAHSSIWPGR
jgi:hypothetical protein